MIKLDDTVGFWVRIENTGRTLPDWKRTFMMHNDGRVFMPAAAALEDEKRMYLAAAYDDAEICVRDSHVYVDSEWLIAQIGAQIGDAELIGVIRSIIERVRKEYAAIDNQSSPD